VIADPTGDLPGARAEGTAIKELFGPDCDLLMHDDATCENVREYLITQYAIIHYCGHVVYSARLGTSLRLRDGNLSADEVADVLRGQPVVFLNGCLTDRRRDPSLREVSRAPEQHEGLADGFITGNELAAARAVIGTMWRVPDEPLDAGRDFTLCFYQKLLGGVAIGEALRCSRVMARDKKWGPMVWSPYTLYGDPLFAPFPAVTQPAQSAAADQAALRRPDQKMADPSEPNAADAEGWPVGSQQASPLPPSLGISGHPVPGEMRIQGWMGRAGRRALNSPYFLIGRYSYLLAGLRVIGWPAMPASECGAPHGPVVEQKTEGPLVTESGTGRAIPTAGDKRLENGRLVKSPISVGLLLKVVTAALLYLIYNSSEATRRSSDSLADALMRNSGTAEREQAARDERMQQGDKAWVVIGTVILDEPLALGKRPAAVLTIKNTGRSPAEHVTVAGDLLSSRGHPKRVRDRAKFDMRIYPGADWPLHFPASASLRNQEEIEAIMSGSRQLYLMGSIVYGDKFNKEQSDSFCYTTSGGQLSAGLKMSACPSGNGPY
jgi:hypothetical protein